MILTIFIMISYNYCRISILWARSCKAQHVNFRFNDLWGVDYTGPRYFYRVLAILGLEAHSTQLQLSLYFFSLYHFCLFYLWNPGRLLVTSQKWNHSCPKMLTFYFEDHYLLRKLLPLFNYRNFAIKSR